MIIRSKEFFTSKGEIMSYVDELNNRVMSEMSEILIYCHTCEEQVLELMKVVNCIYNEDEYWDLVDSYSKFRSDMYILENILHQVDDSISMLQIITVKSMINEIKNNFTYLFELLDAADKKIDSDNIDFEAATLLNDLYEKLDFDIIDFDCFQQALKARYFVTYLIESHDVGYNKRYGLLTVLMAESFKTRKEAYLYALKNGISKDSVWSLYK